MRIFDYLKRKPPKDNLARELRETEVRAVTRDIVANAPDMDGIIVIYSKDGQLYRNAGGIDTLMELLTIVDYAKHEWMHEGLEVHG